jgi:hypothetical protein
LAGKHEPPSKRSFYFSLATSTLRAIILVAAVALGVFALARAFDGNPTEGVAGSPSAQPTTTASPTTTSPSDSPSPTESARPPEDVVVQVLNGTQTAGLASQTSNTLETAGYITKEASNYETTETTTIYYQPGFEVEAGVLQEQYFPTAQLDVAPDSFPADVNITIILGGDYQPT